MYTKLASLATSYSIQALLIYTNITNNEELVTVA